LAGVEFVHELALCDQTGCQDPSHTQAIERLYEDIVSSLKQAAQDFSEEKGHGF
jgi:hypothetical protein